MIAESAITLATQIAGAAATLGAIYYIVHLTVRFNVDLGDRWRTEADRARVEADHARSEADAARDEADQLRGENDLNRRQVDQLRAQLADCSDQLLKWQQGATGENS